ncbi:restriction endonuclease subunit S, partial [Heyndrickxia sporothermodurans]
YMRCLNGGLLVNYHYTRFGEVLLFLSLKPLDTQGLRIMKFIQLINKKEKMIKLLELHRQSIITEAVTKGLNPNVKMKDSGVEWIGKIPEHWEISKIKYQTDINKNTLAENTDSSYEMQYIDIGSVNSKGELSTLDKYRFSDAPSRARRKVKKGDTIVSTVRTYLKAIATIESEDENLVCSTGFAVLTARKAVREKYLSYLFKSTIYVDEIVSRSTGVSYPAINASEIGNLECLLPTLDEQKAIEIYIDKRLLEIDNLVKNIIKQIKKLKEYRQSLIYEAVTGKIDVRDMELEKVR